MGSSEIARNGTARTGARPSSLFFWRTATRRAPFITLLVAVSAIVVFGCISGRLSVPLQWLPSHKAKTEEGPGKSTAGLHCPWQAGDFRLPGVSFRGAGRCRCSVGEECIITVTGPPELWDSRLPLRRDAVLTLVGPAIVAAESEADMRSPIPTFYMRYKPWDEGLYSALLYSGCPNKLLANFSVFVGPAVVEDSWEGWQGVAPEGGAAGVAEGAGGRGRGGRRGVDAWEAATVQEACRNGVFARWKWVSRPPPLSSLPLPNTPAPALGPPTLEWEAFPCAPSVPRPEEWVDRLAERGIRELVVIGDSHMRMLIYHVAFVLEGYVPVPPESSAGPPRDGNHGDVQFNLTSRSSGNVLQVAYYWVDGVYRNEEFGCRARGKYSGRPDTMPDVVPTSGVILVDDASAWTTQSCIEPERAIAKHAPVFFDWVETLALPGARLVFRTNPPFAAHCSRRMSVLRFDNWLTWRLLQPRTNATWQLFDSWHVERPRWREICKDYHYSCYDEVKVNGHKTVHMIGAVGEGVVQELMRFLVHGLQ